MYQIAIHSIKNNQVNFAVLKKLNFDSNYTMDNDNVKYPQPLPKFKLRKVNKACVKYYNDLKYIWDSRVSEIKTKEKHIKPDEKISVPIRYTIVQTQACTETTMT